MKQNCGDIKSYLDSFDINKEKNLMSALCLQDLIHEICKIREKSHPGYTKRQMSLLCNIRRLQEELNMILFPSQVDSVFWLNFNAFMKEKGLCNNSIKLIDCQLKSILDFGVYYGVVLNPTYSDLPSENVIINTIALTPDEVSAIYHLDIKSLMIWSEKQKKYVHIRKDKVRTLSNVKDMFVLSCNLGQRFSDMHNITKSNFDNNVFRIVQQKTGCVAEMNIDRLSIDPSVTYTILKKYNYRAPFLGDISNYNKHLKELFRNTDLEKHLKIDEIDSNGDIVSKFIPRVRKISSHVARRTFCTENFRRRNDFEEIRRATGHQDEDTLISYIKAQRIYVQ